MGACCNRFRAASWSLDAQKDQIVFAKRGTRPFRKSGYRLDKTPLTDQVYMSTASNRPVTGRCKVGFRLSLLVEMFSAAVRLVSCGPASWLQRKLSCQGPSLSAVHAACVQKPVAHHPQLPHHSASARHYRALMSMKLSSVADSRMSFLLDFAKPSCQKAQMTSLFDVGERQDTCMPLPALLQHRRQY